MSTCPIPSYWVILFLLKVILRSVSLIYACWEWVLMNVIFNSFWLIHACWESVFCNGRRQGTTKLWKLLYLINILHTKLNTMWIFPMCTPMAFRLWWSGVDTYSYQGSAIRNESEENLKILCQSLVLNSCLSHWLGSGCAQHPGFSIAFRKPLSLRKCTREQIKPEWIGSLCAEHPHVTLFILHSTGSCTFTTTVTTPINNSVHIKPVVIRFYTTVSSHYDIAIVIYNTEYCHTCIHCILLDCLPKPCIVACHFAVKTDYISQHVYSVYTIYSAVLIPLCYSDYIIAYCWRKPGSNKGNP